MEEMRVKRKRLVPEPSRETALTWDTVRGDYFQTIGAK